MQTEKSLVVSPTIEDILEETHIKMKNVKPRTKYGVQDALDNASMLDAILAETQLKETEKELKMLDARINKGTDLFNSLLGCEQTTKLAVRTKLDKLSVARMEAHKKIDQQRTEKYLADQYPKTLNLDVLTWRTPEGWPSLMLFDPGTAEAKFTKIGFQYCSGARNEGTVEGSHYFAKNQEMFNKYYQDIDKKLYTLVAKKDGERLNGDKFASVSCTFSGIIPTDVKDSIKSAQSKGLFKNIYILCETPNWEVNEITIINVDPIVVGWTGERLHVIATFDLTDLESSALDF